MDANTPQPKVQPPRRRPLVVRDAQGRPLGCHRLCDLLRDHLDLGHPDSQEAADDILAIAAELDLVSVAPSSRRRVIRRLQELDAARSVLSWPEVEGQLHQLLGAIICRLEHTHPRRPKMMKLPTATQIPPPRRRAG